MQKKIVMFVDDDQSFLDFTEVACRKVEAIESMLKATDGEEGLRVLEAKIQDHQTIPKVIFVDINMPGMDGFEFLKGFAAMKQKHPEILSLIKPIAMLTSSDQERDKQKALHMGADAYLIKPGSLAEMRAILAEAVA